MRPKIALVAHRFGSTSLFLWEKHRDFNENRSSVSKTAATENDFDLRYLQPKRCSYTMGMLVEAGLILKATRKAKATAR